MNEEGTTVVTRIAENVPVLRLRVRRAAATLIWGCG
jgi:hypothetical protein